MLEGLSVGELPEKEPTEEGTALTRSAWAYPREVLLDLSWLWITLLIITITGIAVYWSVRAG